MNSTATATDLVADRKASERLQRETVKLLESKGVLLASWDNRAKEYLTGGLVVLATYAPNALSLSIVYGSNPEREFDNAVAILTELGWKISGDREDYRAYAIAPSS